MTGRPAPDPGLHHAESPVLESVDLRRRLTPARVALQLAGLLVGLALLGWAVSLALNAQSDGSIAAFRTASPRMLGLLLGLSFVGLALNGAMFWLVLLPLRRLSAIDVFIVNAMATALSILPFKLGLLARALIHHRRDGLRFGQVLSWMAAMASLAASVLLPLALASAWRGRLDGLWWATVLGGTALGAVAAVTLGRLADRHRLLHRLSLGADAIVRRWSPVLAHAALRLTDVGVLAARFLVAASIVGYAMTPERAALFAATYFLISVLAPTGTIGVREMGVAGIGWIAKDDQNALALVALIVSASELVCAVAVSLLGWVRVRPDRLLLRRPSP